MDFRACVVIPIYNHKDTIESTVAAIVQQRAALQMSLPCLIVDDGSNADTKAVLAALPAQYADVSVHTLARNGGKGAAVSAGLQLASTLGFTHALQIDADGQHDCNDVPSLLALSQKNPAAIICGQPIYDDSVPRGRLYGRYITHFWVGVETLSVHPLDALCGFRVYPVAACVALLARVKLGERMDFDPEILVRLIWDGVPALGVPTRVIYPPQGLSHFDYVRDNVRISLMHTRLVLAMLLRLPQLLKRKWQMRDQRHWSEIGERGSTLGMRALLFAFRHGGRGLCALLLYPVLLYFVLFNRSAREASLDYWRRLHAATNDTLLPAPGWLTTYRHFLSFGESALDRVSGWAGRITRADIEFARRDDVLRLSEGGRGAVLLGAHLGNLELCRALSDGIDGLRMTVLVFTQHALKFNALLQQVNPRVAMNLIQVSELTPDVAIVLRQRIDAGELLVIVGDRTPVDARGRVSVVPFLGKPAAFPQGPYIIASLLECPVYLLFCIKEAGQYRVYLEDFAARIELNRRQRDEQLRALAARYAQRLEYYCHRVPMQWFNFYDYWRVENAPENPVRTSKQHV